MPILIVYFLLCLLLLWTGGMRSQTFWAVNDSESRLNKTISGTQEVNQSIHIFDFDDDDEPMTDPLEELLNDYVSVHGINALINDPGICQRQFIVGHYTCRQIGKFTSGFLYDFIDSIASNRTFLWAHCDGSECSTKLSSCPLSVNQWVPHSMDILKILTSRKCTDKVQEVQSKLGESHLRFDSRANYANFSYAESKSIVMEKIFMYGSDAAYGAAFRAAFSFNDTLLLFNSAIMRSSIAIDGLGRDRVLLVGIHARHPSELSEVGFVKYTEEKECIKHMISITRPIFGERYCVLLISADRNHTLIGLSTFANSIGCEIINGKESKRYLRSQILPGNDDGFSMISDLELLSNSDVFIGSTFGGGSGRSFFSALVAGVLAINQRGSQNIVWMPDSNCKGGFLETNIPVYSKSCPKHIVVLENKPIKAGSSKEVFIVRNCTRHR